MRQVTLNIPESKFSFFMKLVNSLKFIQISESSQEINLNSKQMVTLENIKQGFEELKLVEAGKLKTRPIEELLNELEQ
jgi:hypothetical protein